MSTPRNDIAFGQIQQERIVLEKVFATEVDRKYQWYVTNTQREQTNRVAIITSRPIHHIVSARILPFVAYFGAITAPEYIGVFIHEWSGQCHTTPNGEKYHFKLASASFLTGITGTLSMTGRYAASNEFIFTNRIREITTLTVSVTDFRAPIVFGTSEYVIDINTWDFAPSGFTPGRMTMTSSELPAGLAVGTTLTILYSPDIDLPAEYTSYDEDGAVREPPPQEHPSYLLKNLLPNGFQIATDLGGGAYELDYTVTLPTSITAGDLFSFRVTPANAPPFVIPLEISYVE